MFLEKNMLFDKKRAHGSNLNDLCAISGAFGITSNYTGALSVT